MPSSFNPSTKTLFVSLVPIYMVQLGPDFLIFALVLFGYYFWCYKEVAGPAGEPRPSWYTENLGTRSFLDLAEATMSQLAVAAHKAVAANKGKIPLIQVK